MCRFPAPQSSTVQILGAEKALFRALKTRGNTPKYGLIFHSSFIGRAKVRPRVDMQEPVAMRQHLRFEETIALRLCQC